MSFDLPEKKQDSYSLILRFMTKADITLSAQDEGILGRWIYCDVLMRTKKYSEEDVIDKVVNHYKVSTFTARNDIYFTQRLFAKTRLIQKKYLIAQHLERIDLDIEKVRKHLLTEVTDEESGKKYLNVDAKELVALAKLHEVYTYTLNSIGDDIERTPLPPPIFQFTLPPGIDFKKPLDTKTALEQADEYMKLDKDGVYKPDEDK